MLRGWWCVVGWGLLLLLLISMPALTTCLPTPVGRARHEAAVMIVTTGPSKPPSSDTPFHKRQLEIDGPFTFAFPFPAPTPTNPNTNPVPLLLSPYFPYASTKSNVSPLTTSSTINPTTTTTTSSTSIPSATSTSNPNAVSNANNNSNGNSSASQTHLTASTFLPFILLTSLFLIALIGWCLHGWCTRRPKVLFSSVDKTTGNSNGQETRRKRGWFSFTGNANEREELVCGPEYVGSGTRDRDLMGNNNKYDYPERTERRRFKWPSISLAERQGYRYRLAPEDDARVVNDERLLQAVRSIPLNNPPPSPAEMRVVVDKLKRNPHSASTVGIMSPTSIALKDLYEAVLKSGLSSPSSDLVLQECDEWRRDEEEEEEGTPLLGQGQVSASGSGLHITMSGKKRRGHVRHDDSSDDLLWSAHRHHHHAKGNSLARGSDSRTKLEVRNPSVGQGRLGLRELDDEEEDLVDVDLGGRAKNLADREEEEEYTPLPTPTKVAPRSGRPLLVSKDTGFNVMLPEHPKQITSPPLESQILFVPIKSTITSPPRKSSHVQPKAKLKRERYAAVESLQSKVPLPLPHGPDVVVNGDGGDAKGKRVKSARVRERERNREMDLVNANVIDHEQKRENRGDVQEALLHREEEEGQDKALRRVEKIVEKGWMQRSMMAG